MSMTVTASGNVGADAEVRSGADGTEWATVRVAVSFKDKKRESEHTDWYTVRAKVDSFAGRRIAESRKGDRIVFAGVVRVDVGDDGKVWRTVWGPEVFEAVTRHQGGGQSTAKPKPAAKVEEEDDFDPFAND